jgi:tetratricopeptide (TPR) repeat protein
MHVSGIVIDLERDSKDSESFIETLLQITDYEFDLKETKHSIKNSTEARQAIKALEKNLRARGEIGAIAVLSPRIITLLPGDTKIQLLYAMALAAKGDDSQASDLVAKLELDEINNLYALLAEAMIAKRVGQLTTAASAAKQAIAQDPGHPFAYNILGQIRAAQGNTVEAMANFQAAIHRAPEFTAAHSNLGAIYFLQGDYKHAWGSFTKSVELSPQFCPARIGRAASAFQLGDALTAEDDLQACLDSNPKHLPAIKRLTMLYLQTDRLDDAVQLARSTVEQDPVFAKTTFGEISLRMNQPSVARNQLEDIDSPTAQTYYLLSFCETLAGNAPDALSHIEAAEKLQPASATLKLTRHVYTFYADEPVEMESLKVLTSDPSIGPLATFVAGNIYAARGDFKPAYAYWSQAEDLIPGFLFSGLRLEDILEVSSAAEQRHLSMGMLLYLKSYYIAALGEFEKAIAINSDSFMAHFLAALTLTQTGATDQVKHHLLHSHALIPEFFPANYMLAEQYLKQGQTNNALKHYRMAAKSEPDQGVLIKLGLLYEGQGKTREAEEIYQLFIEHHSNSFLGYNQLAWLYAKQGIKLNQALILANKANQKRSNNASVNDTIGWIHFQLRNYERAENFLQKANQISQGKNPDILYHLAALEYAKGNINAAQDLLMQALGMSDNFESFDEAELLLSKINLKGDV